jgi:hypothetical protein
MEILNFSNNGKTKPNKGSKRRAFIGIVQRLPPTSVSTLVLSNSVKALRKQLLAVVMNQ